VLASHDELRIGQLGWTRRQLFWMVRLEPSQGLGIARSQVAVEILGLLACLLEAETEGERNCGHIRPPQDGLLSAGTGEEGLVMSLHVGRQAGPALSAD
jgi:hypothetical protein